MKQDKGSPLRSGSYVALHAALRTFESRIDVLDKIEDWYFEALSKIEAREQGAAQEPGGDIILEAIRRDDDADQASGELAMLR